MDYPRTPLSSDLSSKDIFIMLPENQSDLKVNWSDNMLQQQQLLQAKKQLLGVSSDENKQNLGKLYSTKQMLNVDAMPRRESLWRSLTRSATSILGRQINNTGAILRTWSNVNMSTPLSVTVVSQDLYKSLQENKDHQVLTPSSGFCTTSGRWKQANYTGDDLYDAEIMSNRPKRDTDPGDSEKRWNEYKLMYINSNDKETKDQDIVNSVNNSQSKGQLLDEPFEIVTLRGKGLGTSVNFAKPIKIADEPVMLKKPEDPLPEALESEITECNTLMKGIIASYKNKVVNGATDKLQDLSTLGDPVLFTKRAGSPDEHTKKVHNASAGHSRDTGRAHEYRSGVSQKRHRKRRGRHAVEKDMKSDAEAWQEYDYCESSDDELSVVDVDECDFVQAIEPTRSDSLCDVSKNICLPEKIENIEFDDVLSAEEESKESEECVASHESEESEESEDSENSDDSDDSDDIEELEINEESDDSDSDDDPFADRNSFRSRLSSCNSEDSYCIVFDEDAPEDDSSIVDDQGDESESESESDDGNTRKVRFNLVPVVHQMIAWRFAYHAARKNLDVRNRDHFRARIARTGRVLDLVLQEQFRDRIYRERFEE